MTDQGEPTGPAPEDLRRRARDALIAINAGQQWTDFDLDVPETLEETIAVLSFLSGVLLTALASALGVDQTAATARIEQLLLADG